MKTFPFFSISGDRVFRPIFTLQLIRIRHLCLQWKEFKLGAINLFLYREYHDRYIDWFTRFPTFVAFYAGKVVDATHIENSGLLYSDRASPVERQESLLQWMKGVQNKYWRGVKPKNSFLDSPWSSQNRKDTPYDVEFELSGVRMDENLSSGDQEASDGSSFTETVAGIFQSFLGMKSKREKEAEARGKKWEEDDTAWAEVEAIAEEERLRADANMQQFNDLEADRLEEAYELDDEMFDDGIDDREHHAAEELRRAVSDQSHTPVRGSLIRSSSYILYFLH